MGDARDRRAVILTGERGVGKTTLCLEMARGRPGFAGIVSPAIVDSAGTKVGFSALCLQTGERWELGRSDADLGGPRYGKYSFSAEGFARAIECLERALQLPDRIVVLDEIGPLEMQQKAGFAPILPLLRDAGRLLLVTRLEYCAALAGLLRLHEKEQVDMTSAGASAAGDAISRFLAHV